MHAFDLEDQEIEQTPANNSSIKQRIEEVGKQKYTAGTYTKGFFIRDLEDQQQQHNKQLIKSTVPVDSSDKRKQQLEKRRTKRGPITLAPLKQTQQTSVFENFSKNNQTQQPQLEELEEIKIEKPQHQEKKEEKTYQTRRMAQKRLKSSLKENQVQIKQQQEQQPIQIPKSSTPIFFQEDEEEDQIQSNNPSELGPTVQNNREIELNQAQSQISIAQNRLIGQIFQQSEEQPQQEQIVPVIAGSDYFTYGSLNLLKKQLTEQVKKGSLLRLQMVRDKDGFNTFWPEFHLYFCNNSHYVMSAKKTSSKPTSTFIISIAKTNYEENSQYYLGKMKSNMMGDILNIYGPGLNPSNAKDKHQMPRQLLATVVYDSHIFQMGKPRQFQVFVKKDEYRYYSNFPQVRMYDDQIPLHQLFQYPQNKQKIKVYHNRKPVWLQQIGGYMLNFKGRVETASIKNFILQQKLNGPQTMIFGKVNQSKFNLDMTYPIAPIVAFCVALSTFDSRIMCE